MQSGYILDPAAGGDEKRGMPYPEALKEIGVNRVITMDIRQDSPALLKEDYLQFSVPPGIRVIITNPPFSLIQEYIKKGLADVTDDGWVIYLLRLNYFGSKERKPFWDQLMPVYVFVDHKRISFTGDGKKDSCEYAHFCFKKGYKGKYSKLFVI